MRICQYIFILQFIRNLSGKKTPAGDQRAGEQMSLQNENLKKVNCVENNLLGKFIINKTNSCKDKNKKNSA